MQHKMCDGGGISTIVEEGACFYGDSIHMAVYNEDVTGLKRLLASGSDPNVSDDVGNIPLHVAVSCNLSNAMHILVDCPLTNCDHQNNLGKTALHLAIESGLYQIATRLIESGASVNLKDHCDLMAVDYCLSMRQPVVCDRQFVEFFTRHTSVFAKVKLKSNRNVVMILAYWDKTDLLDTIIETDATIVRYQDTHKQTPLHYCFSEDNSIRLKSAQILLEAGADINAQNIDGATPLDFLLVHDLSTKPTAKEFVCNVISAHAQIEDRSPLHLAAVIGDVDLLKYAADCGVNLNLQDKDGFTALHLGALHDKINVVRFILTRGIDINPENQRGQIPLHYSSVLPCTTCSELLLHDGALINHKDQFGMTPLHKASGWGTTKIVKLLLQQGADINSQDTIGQLPIHYSALKGLSENTEVVILKGSPVECQDQHGQTPLHLAAQTGHVDVIKLLLLHGADANAQDVKGQSPMHLACWHGQKEAVQTLINRGASKNVVTVDGQTPDQFASERGLYGILSTLRKHRQSLSLYAPEQLKTFEMFRNRTAPTRLASLGHEESSHSLLLYIIFHWNVYLMQALIHFECKICQTYKG